MQFPSINNTPFLELKDTRGVSLVGSLKYKPT